MTSLADSQFVVFSIFNQLRGKRVGNNEAEVACVSGSAGQMVNSIPRLPTGVHKVDVIDSLGPAIFLLFIKMPQQGRIN